MNGTAIVSQDCESLLWDFRCRAVRLPSGYYRVTIVGTQTGTTRIRVGYHPLWELIRLIGTIEKKGDTT